MKPNLGKGRKEGLQQGVRELLGAMDMFIILTEVIVHGYTHILNLLLEKLTVCLYYLDKAVTK